MLTARNNRSLHQKIINGYVPAICSLGAGSKPFCSNSLMNSWLFWVLTGLYMLPIFASWCSTISKNRIHPTDRKLVAYNYVLLEKYNYCHPTELIQILADLGYMGRCSPTSAQQGFAAGLLNSHVAGLQFTKEDHEHDFCFHESTPQNTLITSYYPYPFDLYCWRKLQGCPHVTIFSWFCWGLWMPGQMTSAGCRASENGLKERTNLASGLCSQSALGHRASWIVRRGHGGRQLDCSQWKIPWKWTIWYPFLETSDETSIFFDLRTFWVDWMESSTWTVFSTGDWLWIFFNHVVNPQIINHSNDSLEMGSIRWYERSWIGGLFMALPWLALVSHIRREAAKGFMMIYAWTAANCVRIFFWLTAPGSAHFVLERAF